MNWKDTLKILEQNEEFDVAIFFMRKVIQEDPEDVDAYIYILFRLMYIIVEGSCYFSNVSRTETRYIKQQYYDSKDHEYGLLALQYFQEGYIKFSENAEFLFYIGVTAVMSEWHFGIDVKDYDAMLKKAITLEPYNPLYQRSYYIELDRNDDNNKQKIITYAELVLCEYSPIKKILQSKGTIGEYLLKLMICGAQDDLKRYNIPFPENSSVSCLK